MNKLVLPLFSCFLIGSLLYANTTDPLSILFQIKEKKEQTKEREAPPTLPYTSLSIPSEHSENENSPARQMKQPAALLSGLMSRFISRENQVAVRRSTGFETGELKAVERALLNSDFPYLVWESLGERVRYELYLGDETYHVDPVDEDIVRVKIREFHGTRRFNIKALEGDRLIAELTPPGRERSYKVHVLDWMSGAEMERFNIKMRSLEGEYPDNTIRLGSILEEKDMWIAAMDLYREYLEKNRQDIEVTPYLFKTYKKLKLNKAYNDELKKWSQAMKR